MREFSSVSGGRAIIALVAFLGPIPVSLELASAQSVFCPATVVSAPSTRQLGAERYADFRQLHESNDSGRCFRVGVGVAGDWRPRRFVDEPGDLGGPKSHRRAPRNAAGALSIRRNSGRRNLPGATRACGEHCPAPGRRGSHGRGQRCANSDRARRREARVK